jgi:hypothetical protein
VLVLVEIRIEVVEERRGSSSSADVKDGCHGEDGDEDKGDDANDELKVRQMEVHCDLLVLRGLRWEKGMRGQPASKGTNRSMNRKYVEKPAKSIL